MASLQQPKAVVKQLIVVVVIVVALSNLPHVFHANAHEEVELKNLPAHFNYENYVREYHKTRTRTTANGITSGKSPPPDEWLSRARLFLSRSLQIFKHNIKYVTANRIGYYLRQNRFTDLTPEEIKRDFIIEGLDLPPVQEVTSSGPDTPADEAFQLEQNKLQDGAAKRAAPGVGPFAMIASGIGGGGMINGSGKKATKSSDSLDFFLTGIEDLSVEDILGKDSDVRGVRPKVSRKKAAPASETTSNGGGAGHHQSMEGEEPSERVGRRSRKRAKVEGENLQGFRDSLKTIRDDYLIAALGGVSERLRESYAAGMGDFEYGDDDDVLGYKDGRFHDARDQLEEENEEEEEDSHGNTALIWSFVNSFKSVYVALRDGTGDDYEPEERSEKRKKIEHNPRVDNRAAVIQNDIDWRLTNCLSPIKTQGECNSCYSFASLDLMEFLYCRQKRNQTVEFSAQYIVDCGSKFRLRGCKGGRIAGVGVFIMKLGLQEAASYPYKSAEQACPLDSNRAKTAIEKSALRPKIKGWRMYSEMSAWYKWLPRSPIIVGINMPADFFGYGGAIHDGSNCVKGMAHAMLLVGAGVEKGLEYWLLKNSFSSEWGENGYFRLSKRAPLRCFNSAVVVRANFTVEEAPTNN